MTTLSPLPPPIHLGFKVNARSHSIIKFMLTCAIPITSCTKRRYGIHVYCEGTLIAAHVQHDLMLPAFPNNEHFGAVRHYPTGF